MKRLSAVLVLTLALGACATSGSDTYTAEDVGKVISTAEGTVVTSREVDIEGKTGPIGALAGGAAGGATGYGLSGGSGAVAVLGAVAGAGVGYLVESVVNDGTGIEYVIQMDDGRTVTLVQNKESSDEEPIKDGQPVLIQYGDTYTRVIPLPQNLDSATPTGVWVNPDSLPPGKEPKGKRLDSGDPAEGEPPPAAGPGQPSTDDTY